MRKAVSLILLICFFPAAVQAKDCFQLYDSIEHLQEPNIRSARVLENLTMGFGTVGTLGLLMGVGATDDNPEIMITGAVSYAVAGALGAIAKRKRDKAKEELRFVSKLLRQSYVVTEERKELDEFHSMVARQVAYADIPEIRRILVQGSQSGVFCPTIDSPSHDAYDDYQKSEFVFLKEGMLLYVVDQLKNGYAASRGLEPKEGIIMPVRPKKQ